MKVKKIPQRKCVGCNEMKDKKALLRIVRSPEGEISLDLTGKKNGRGAYVCKNGCICKCEKTHALDRAFKVAISQETYRKLEKEFLEIVG